MMSFSPVTLTDIVKKQYVFKLKAFTDLLSPLLLMQLFGLLFSLGGVGHSGRGNYFNVTYYSTDFVIYFTIIWGFVIAVQLTSKNFRYQLTPFVTNHQANVLSDGLLLLTASIFGGILALLSRFILLAFVMFVFQKDQIIIKDSIESIPELFMGIITTILIIFLFSMLGYAIGSLVQRHRSFAVIIPAIAIGGFFFLILIGDETTLKYFEKLFSFYYLEKNFSIFVLKHIITSIILFFLAYQLTKRLEVAQ